MGNLLRRLFLEPQNKSTRRSSCDRLAALPTKKVPNWIAAFGSQTAYTPTPVKSS
jgi:hypothetical protein